ncbi:MAG: carboxypeptidase-like regulatory domain-containing protein, partial [Caldilinea sp.]
YLLPRVVGADRCVFTTAASRRGRFRFQKMPAGVYTLEVDAEGAHPYRATLPLEGEVDIEIALDADRAIANSDGS